MANADRKASANLKRAYRFKPSVLAEGHRYGFFELLRRLREAGVSHQELRELVRIRPHLSLGFPESDIEIIKEEAQGFYHIEANFFGLYGVSSPLPTFYTEDLIEEYMQGHSAMRDFIDIFHTVFYPLLYQAWEKYRLWLAVVEHKDESRLHQLLALIGFRDLSDRYEEALALLPFAGNLSVGVKSALGLEALLQGLLKHQELSVETCVEQRVSVPPDSRLILGLQANQLGEDTVLGEQIKEITSKIQIRVQGLDASHFSTLLPHTPLFLLIQRVLRWYCPNNTQVDLLLWLDVDQRQPLVLGKKWCQLGLNTWLGTSHQDPLPQLPVRFQLLSRSLAHATY